MGLINLLNTTSYLYIEGLQQLVGSLKRNSRCSVGNIDNAARDEPVLLEYILHHQVVVMCIHSYVRTLIQTPLQTERTNVFYFPRSCQTMYNSVWLVVKPLPVFYPGVSRIFALHEKESRNYFIILINTNIAVLVGHIPHHYFTRRIAVDPLIPVSGLLHKSPRSVINFH